MAGSLYSIIAQYYRDPVNDMARAMHFCEDGLKFAISTGNIKAQSGFLADMAYIKWQTGDYYVGQAHAYEAQKTAQISGHLYTEALALRMESLCWTSLGSFSDSISLSKRARHLLALCGFRGGQLDQSIKNTLAEVHRLKSEYTEARNIQTQILHDVSIKQNPYKHAFALLNLAQIGVETGASKHDMEENINTASSILTTMGHSMARTWCEMIHGALYLSEGDFLRAKNMLKASLTSARGKSSEVVTYCLGKLGCIRDWSAMHPTSSTWTFIFLVHVLKQNEKLEIYKAFQFLGDVYLAEHDQTTAKNLFTLALEGFTQMDVQRNKGECMLRLGDIFQVRGDSQRAVDLWKIARTLLENSLQAKQVVGIDKRLAPRY
jgi:tetratricopeptide (TPR) repeat protein